MTTDKFEQWCILEIMGHQRFAGLVSEQTLGGASFVRIDVPEAEGQPAFTKLFGAGSIYCISPIAEDIARAMAKELRKQPVNVYDLPEELRAKLRTPAIVDSRGVAHDDDEDDDLYGGGDPGEPDFGDE